MRDARRIPCSEWIKRWQEKGTEGLKDKWEYNCQLTNVEENAALIVCVDFNPFLPILHSVNQLKSIYRYLIGQRKDIYTKRTYLLHVKFF